MWIWLLSLLLCFYLVSLGVWTAETQNTPPLPAGDTQWANQMTAITLTWRLAAVSLCTGMERKGGANKRAKVGAINIAGRESDFWAYFFGPA